MAAAAKDAAGDGAFARRTMLLVVIGGIIAFAAMLVLGAYAPGLRSARNGGAHALSNAATGFAGLVMLTNATGRRAVLVRNEHQLQSDDLVVLTPETGDVNLGPALEAREARTTLVILPKWNTVADPDHTGWVHRVGLRDDHDPENVLAPQHQLEVKRHRGTLGAALRTVPSWAPPELRFRAPAALQTISGPEVEPVITDGEGRVVLGQIGGRQLYVLADPDLLANHGIGEKKQAAAALALLDFLNSTEAESVLFDVTLNGFGQSPSPLRLALDPPLLAVTLTSLTAMLLAGLQALVRFGPVRLPARAIAFGKEALIANAAALVRRAGRERTLGERYAQMVRDKAVLAFGVPARLRGPEIDLYLDRLPRPVPFSELVEAARNVTDRKDMLAAARSLHDWQGEYRE